MTWGAGESTEWNLRYRVYTPQPEFNGYFWDFENDTDLPWTSYDADGDGYGWFIWDPVSLGYDPGDGTRLFGTKCATSASYNAYGVLYPDDWMISPKVTLAKDFSFWAAGQDPSYAAEVFAVYVSTTGNDINDFVKISDDIVATSPIEQYTFDLSEYEGMEGYVAIRHYNVSDMFRLNIDNILIGELPEPVEEAEWIYVNGITDPNYTIEGLDPETTYEVQVQAVDEEIGASKWTESTLFTTLEGGEEPPVQEGIFIVLIDQEGNEYQYNLYPSPNNPNNYVNMVTLEYNPWGAFDPYYEERPVVPFYFIVNGERLGAEEDMTPTAMGPIDQTLQNPLFANENCYTVPVGYTYTIGIQFTADGGMYVLCAQGGMVGVDELNADKAVAGVRYYNVAGQEMQQADGLTIVVTTYTDGSTSVAKVVK